jgi:hypothetical protein
MLQRADLPEEIRFGTKRQARMISFALLSITQIIGFGLSTALVIVPLWIVDAQAQSPADDQNGEPSAPSGPALGTSGVPANEAKAGDGSNPQTAYSEAGVIPATGGQMLLVYLATLAAAGVGLVILDGRSGRGR